MRWLVLLVGSGCGRVGFDATPTDVFADSGADTFDAGPPCPALPGIEFCESFEGAPKLGTLVGNVTVDPLRAYRGTMSQHAATTAASETSWQIGQVLPTLTSGDLYARWFVYLPGTVTSAHLASVHLVENLPPFHGIIFGVRDGVAELTSTEAGITAFSTVSIPRDRWVCLQMHVQISDTAGAIDGAVDGQPFGVKTNIDTAPAAGYRNVHVGVFSTGFATGPIEMWSDDVAVGTQPIPCG